MRQIAIGLISLGVLSFGGCSNASKTDVERGRLLATTLGCVSCHGARMDGHLFQNEPGVAVIYSANASRIMPAYSDAALREMLVSGKRRDGTALWVMPPASFAVLNRSDMNDLIRWLRTIPPTGTSHPPITIGPLWQKAIDAGQIKPPSAMLAAELAHPPIDLGKDYARGRYLARTVCAECHEPNLGGQRDPQPGDAPDLNVAAAYDAAAFRRLLRTGKGLDRADLGLMTEAAKERLNVLSDSDIEALRNYLVARSRHS